MAKLLSQVQIEAYAADGYLCPLDCLTAAEARAYRDRFEAFEREYGEDVRKGLRVKPHIVFPWLVDLVKHPKILDVVEDLIGPDIFVFLSSVWFKNAHDPAYVSWHQDTLYYGIEPHEVATAWIAFSDSTVESGCVRVLPGSHRGRIADHVETRSENNLLSRGQTIEAVDEADAVDMVLAAGQFSLHHERLIHGSNPNRSDDRRMGMSVNYMPARVRSVIGRQPALLVRGEDTHGHWDPDPEPRFDYDPVCVAHMKRCIAGYNADRG